MTKKRKVWLRDNYTCHYCGCDLKHEYIYFYPSDSCQITVDHVIPKHLGGGNTYENLVTSCKACNQTKAKREEPIRKLKH